LEQRPYNYPLASTNCYKAYAIPNTVIDCGGCPGDCPPAGQVYSLVPDYANNVHTMNWDSWITGHNWWYLRVYVGNQGRYMTQTHGEYGDLSSSGGGAAWDLYCMQCADGHYLTAAAAAPEDPNKNSGRCCEGTATFNNPGAGNSCCYEGGVYAHNSFNALGHKCLDGLWQIPSCTIKSACDVGENDLFHIHNLLDGHSELNTQNNFNWKVCCKGITSSIGSGEDEVLGFSSSTEAHVEKDTQNNFATRLFLNADGGTISCDYKSSCAADELCVIGLTPGDTELHTGGCANQDTDLCCKILPCTDNDRDGFFVEGGECGIVDCNDNNGDVYPGATEVCNGIDDDCNPVTLDGSGESAPLNTLQQGVCVGSTQSCGGPAGWVDDYSAVANYESVETTCDGLDNDCDGEVDEACPVCTLRDRSSGCYSYENPILNFNARTDTHVELATYGNFDYVLCCRDLTASISTGQWKVLGLSSETDAHVQKRDYVPAYTYDLLLTSEVPGQTVSCTYKDTCTEPEFCMMSLSPGDTDLHVASCEPAETYSTKVCCQHVNLCIDNDGDGYGVSDDRRGCSAGEEFDCDDTNENVHPGATDVCNGIDDDCNGVIDGMSRSCYTGLPLSTQNNFPCRPGSETCDYGTWSSCIGEVTPYINGEICGNTADDNCDGQVNEGCVISQDANISGTVYNQSLSEVVPGAWVEIRWPPKTTLNVIRDITDANGEYNFTDITAQDYTIVAGKGGYDEQYKDVSLQLGQDLIVDFNLPKDLTDTECINCVKWDGDKYICDPDCIGLQGCQSMTNECVYLENKSYFEKARLLDCHYCNGSTYVPLFGDLDIQTDIANLVKTETIVTIGGKPFKMVVLTYED